MKPDKIREFLETLGCTVRPRQSRTGWVVSDCPMGWKHDNGHSGPAAFGVQEGHGIRFCSCWSCGFHGDQEDLVIELRARDKRVSAGHRDYKRALALIDEAREEFELDFDMPDYEARLFTAKIPLHAFSEEWLATFPTVAQASRGMDYLRKRNVPVPVAEALDIRFDPVEMRVCFPVRDFSGVLRGFHGRALKDTAKPKYRMYPYDNKTNPIVWLGESWVDLDKPVLMVEGPLDLTSTARVYRNVVTPLFASANYEKFQRMSAATNVVTLFDTGKAGDMARDKADLALTGSVITHLQPPSGIKDPGAMSISELQELLSDHLELDEPVT